MVRFRKNKLVERDNAATLLLISVLSFASTVVLVRLFLELTGYPQVGNGTLHIAHLLWGGLALFIAVLILLIWDNPEIMVLSAMMSGLGVGLFMDEVGKFITQNNDYFFPAAAPIIYAFFIIFVIVYLLVRRQNPDDPQRAIILALERLQDAVYADLDEEEGKRLLTELEIARHHSRPEIGALADQLWDYVVSGNVPFKDYTPTRLQQIQTWLEEAADRLGRVKHRWIIILVLSINMISAMATLTFFIWVAISPQVTTNDLLERLVEQAQQADAGGVTIQLVHAGLEIAVGLVGLLAIIAILLKKEKTGMALALAESILALTVLQVVTFYMDQFTAIIPTLFQFFAMLLVVSYQTMYLSDSPAKAAAYFRKYSQH